MAEYTVFNLATQVDGMRNAQRSYFKIKGKANNTRLPADHDEAKRILEISKLLEKSVDETLKDIFDNDAQDKRVLIDLNTYQQIIDNQNEMIEACQKAKIMLLDQFGLLGGGNRLNEVFEVLNKVTDKGVES